MFQSHKARIQISLLLTGCATWENITLTSLCLSFLIGKMLLIIVPFLYGFGLVWFLRIRLTCKSLEQSWNKVSIQLILIIECLLYVSCEAWNLMNIVSTPCTGRRQCVPTSTGKRPEAHRGQVFSPKRHGQDVLEKGKPKLTLPSCSLFPDFSPLYTIYVTFATCVLSFTKYPLTWFFPLDKYSINVNFISLLQVRWCVGQLS